MGRKIFLLTLPICAALITLPTPKAVALGVCEKEAGQCIREADVSFRQEKKVIGDMEARNLQDQRRFQCRSAMKKCKAVLTRNRDLRIGGPGVNNSGRLNNPSYAPGR